MTLALLLRSALIPALAFAASAKDSGGGSDAAARDREVALLLASRPACGPAGKAEPARNAGKAATTISVAATHLHQAGPHGPAVASLASSQ